jgi:DHA1 family multidrug resistance protein-like MFS transporter
MLIMPIGLLIFGWTANAPTHWIGPQFGFFLVALGLMLAFNSIQNLCAYLSLFAYRIS